MKTNITDFLVIADDDNVLLTRKTISGKTLREAVLKNGKKVLSDIDFSLKSLRMSQAETLSELLYDDNLKVCYRDIATVVNDEVILIAGGVFLATEKTLIATELNYKILTGVESKYKINEETPGR